MISRRRLRSLILIPRNLLVLAEQASLTGTILPAKPKNKVEKKPATKKGMEKMLDTRPKVGKISATRARVGKMSGTRARVEMMGTLAHMGQRMPP